MCGGHGAERKSSGRSKLESDVEFLPILIEGRKREAFRKLIVKRKRKSGERGAVKLEAAP